MTNRLEQNSQEEQRRVWGMGEVIMALGVGCTFFALLFAIAVPIFVPPLLQWSGYTALWKPIGLRFVLGPWLAESFWIRVFLSPIGLSFILGPWLVATGFYGKGQWSATQWRSGLRMILGGQLLLIALFWLGRDVFYLQKVGWMAFLQVPQWKFPFYGLWGAPPLLALGIGLFHQRTWRDHVGLVLATASYTALIFLGLYISFVLMAPKFMVILNPAAFQMPKTGFIWLGIFFGTGLVGTWAMTSSLRLRFHLLMTCPLWLPFFIVFFFWSLLIHTTFYFLEEIFSWELHFPIPASLLAQSWLLLILLPVGAGVGCLFLDPAALRFLRVSPQSLAMIVGGTLLGSGWRLLLFLQKRQRPTPMAVWEPFAVLVVSLIALCLFPLLLTIDFCIGLMGFLGQNAIHRFFPRTEQEEGQEVVVSPAWVYAMGAALLLTAPLWLLPAALFWAVRLFVYESLLQPWLDSKSRGRDAKPNPVVVKPQTQLEP